jgi:hypothetical protein
MTKRNRKIKNKGQVSQYSGKILNGSASIRCCEAKDYLRSLGYLVSNNRIFDVIKNDKKK